MLAGSGEVYTSEVDSLYAFDAATGARRWSFRPDSTGVVIPVMDETTVYTGQSTVPVVYALAHANGALRWHVDLSAGREYRFGGYVRGSRSRTGGATSR